MSVSEMECLLTVSSDSDLHTKTLASALAARCTSGDCILLSGDLGAGKTVFARGFIQALCGEAEEVTSPTFTLMQQYQARDGWPIWHFDLYRLKSAVELEQLGMDDALVTGITLIEWPEIAASHVPDSALRVQLLHAGDSARTIHFSGKDVWKKKLEGLQ
jgi:tRNA threonylcarbamoyl adenosine modification protein YjeE